MIFCGRQRSVNIMADSEHCAQAKGRYDECFSSWYRLHSADKAAAKRTLSACNELPVAYKSCVSAVLAEDYLQTPPGMRSHKYR